MVESCTWAIHSLCTERKMAPIAAIKCIKEAIHVEISWAVTLSGASACCPLCCDQCKPRSHGESLDRQVRVHASPRNAEKLGWGWTSFIPKWWDTDLNLQQAAIKVNNVYSICSVHFMVKISWKDPQRTHNLWRETYMEKREVKGLGFHIVPAEVDQASK